MSQARRWFQHSHGGRQGVLHGPVRAQIVGISQAVCFFFAPQHPPLSEQFLRMSQASRWFQHSQGGGPTSTQELPGSFTEGVYHGPFRA